MNIKIKVVMDNGKISFFDENVVSYTVNERELQVVLSKDSETRVVGFNFNHIIKYEIVKKQNSFRD